MSASGPSCGDPREDLRLAYVSLKYFRFFSFSYLSERTLNKMPIPTSLAGASAGSAGVFGRPGARIPSERLTLSAWGVSG